MHTVFRHKIKRIVFAVFLRSRRHVFVKRCRRRHFFPFYLYRFRPFLCIFLKSSFVWNRYVLFFAAAAHSHALWLIQFSRVRSVIAEQKTLFDSFQGKVYAPVFAVYRYFCIIIQRSVRIQILIHIINNGFFHICGVCVLIIENQFIQSKAVSTLRIMVKFQFETVPVRIRVICNRGQTGISFGPDADVIKGCSVDFNVAGIIRLVYGMLQQFCPVVYFH